MAEPKLVLKSKKKYTLYRKGTRLDKKSPYGLTFPCVLIIGGSGAGKSCYIINTVKKSLNRKYDRIYLIKGSDDTTLIDELDIDPSNVYSNVSDMDKILDESGDDSKLIILDDMIQQLKNDDMNSTFLRVIIACHHHHVAMLITCHSAGAEVASIIKKNHHSLVLMPNGLSHYDILNVEKYSQFSKQKIESAYKLCCSKKLPLTLANINPTEFLCGFDKYKFV